MSSLEPELRLAIEGKVDRELAGRAIAGSMAYFLVCVVVAVSTPYYTDHPLAVLLAGSLTLLVGSMRLLSARHLLKHPDGDLSGAVRVFYGTTYATFVIWGCFCAWTIHWYAGTWTSMLVLFCTAALAAGASSTLAPDLSLASRCLIVLLAPAMGSALALGNPRYFAPVALALIYVVFLLAQTRGTWRAFWEASAAAEREKRLGSAERRREKTERASLVAAVEQVAEEILVTDLEGNIQYCNPSFERSTGYLCSEIVGRNPSFLKSDKHAAQFYAELWSKITGGETWTGRIVNRRKDGTLYHAECAISPIRDFSGHTMGFVSAARDVTSRLIMEEQLRQAQKMEGIGRLAGGVAHDFNNLLTVIAGYSRLLEEKLDDDDPLLDYAQQISRASEHAASLTRQLLTFSRKQIIKPKPIDLNALVGGMKQMLQRLVGEDVEVIADLAQGLGQVRADADQMSQVLINLTANARDAMPDGGKLWIRTANVEPGENSAAENREAMPTVAVMLAVSDTGVGMSYETRQNIFEPFFTTKERGRGTGMGLSTVYGIVKQSGGHIDVRSEPGKGATFSIYLPRIEAAPPVREGGEPVAARGRGSETILVVEDDEGVRRLIVGTLAMCGFKVLQAADGTGALAEATQHAGSIDLLLTDVIMPGMNGKEVADRLTALRPGIKVLFISGYSGELIAKAGVLHAGIAYLPKPFTSDVLAARVREMLGTQK